MFISYRNQPIDWLCKSIDWFLHDRDLRHGRVNAKPHFLSNAPSKLIILNNKVVFPLSELQDILLQDINERLSNITSVKKALSCSVLTSRQNTFRKTVASILKLQ